MERNHLQYIEDAFKGIPESLLLNTPSAGGLWGNVQINVPALLKQHLCSMRINDETTPAGDSGPSLSDEELQQLLQPPHEVVLKAVELVRWQQLLVTALDMSGWPVQPTGFKKLISQFEHTAAMRKLVLSNCGLTADTAGRFVLQTHSGCTSAFFVFL